MNRIWYNRYANQNIWGVYVWDNRGSLCLVIRFGRREWSIVLKK